jgi:hypothetical protein
MKVLIHRRNTPAHKARKAVQTGVGSRRSTPRAAFRARVSLSSSSVRL